MREGELLFHGTGIYCLASIIAEDRLLAGTHWGKPDEPHGPRFSEEYEIAKGFCAYNIPEGEGGVLIVNAHKLSKNYTLRPYRDRYYSGEQMQDEKEIVAIAFQIEHFSKYLESIIVDESIIDLAFTSEYMDYSKSEGGWPFGEEAACIDKCHRALDRLGSHPLLNAPVIELDDFRQRTRMRMH